ncbi:DOPA 4,5-dioxygenase family protein [Inhella gelatinilytica]|uniref:DOPA 4,5-dioxygenase family protein n=1 Tax=Inhella gelatinilytica TaxID=2795030 RepID=A0A931IUU3_9BURK|nr:DOPA 4,5-dioxygenase family protein [Inhella gelatinilytica]MBH9551415.1 DOPA 4,5-dioxygenase family protein [Inhella gelatinilytica]
MRSLDPSRIHSWHAHVYFEDSTQAAARALRGALEADLGPRIRLGRFNEGPVGPHPVGSYEIAFLPEHLPAVLGWLLLNRGTLDVLLHPNSDNELRDHREGALWLGRPHALDLAGLQAGPSVFDL